MNRGGYIKDGLIFHLDGINKGDDDSVWTDLVDGIKFNMIKCIKQDNCFEFNGIDSYGKAINISKFPTNYETQTIEITYNNLNTSNYILFASNYPNGLALGWFVYGYIFNHCPSNTPLYSIGNKQGDLCVSCNSIHGIVNKIDISKSILQCWYVRGSEVTIGHNDSYYHKGKIYSIRIYNRKLTKDEIIHNQNIDIQRFNLKII